MIRFHDKYFFKLQIRQTYNEFISMMSQINFFDCFE